LYIVVVIPAIVLMAMG